MSLGLLVYACLVAALVLAEIKDARAAQRILKPVTAFGFILIAVAVGAIDHQYGRLILIGLIACAAGDVLLLSRESKALFLWGMAAFAIGHFAYLTAFVPYQAESYTFGKFIKAIFVIFSVVTVMIWLNPHVPAKMRLAVKAYMLVILFMVLNALDLPIMPPLGFAMIGAVMFAVSDIFVARDRFVKRSTLNAIAITPLYFGGQALIALSAQASF